MSVGASPEGFPNQLLVEGEVSLTIDFRIRQLERSFKNICEIAIVRAGGRLVIRLRAFEAFSPDGFDGLDVDLEVHTDKTVAPVRAKLMPLPVEAPRGTWFPYAVIFRDSRDEERIKLDAENLFSNVSRVTLFPQGEPTPSLVNPFYRAA